MIRWCVVAEPARRSAISTGLRLRMVDVARDPGKAVVAPITGCRAGWVPTIPVETLQVAVASPRGSPRRCMPPGTSPAPWRVGEPFHRHPMPVPAPAIDRHGGGGRPRCRHGAWPVPSDGSRTSIGPALSAVVGDLHWQRRRVGCVRRITDATSARRDCLGGNRRLESCRLRSSSRECRVGPRPPIRVLL